MRNANKLVRIHQKKQLLRYNEELQKYKHLALVLGRCGLEYFFSANIQNKNEK